nr:hypothetical protein [Tanacetum cinerariifolium]
MRIPKLNTSSSLSVEGKASTLEKSSKRNESYSREGRKSLDLGRSKEVDLFLFDNSIPPGIENVADDPEGDVQPPDDNFDLEPEVISAVMEDNDEPDEHFNPGGEIFVSTNNKDVDYFPFMIVIRIFLPYLILLEISPLFLSAESEDTIFDPGLSPGD